MLEQLVARAKLTLFVVLFLSPVAVSAWSRSLDQWLESNPRYDPPVEADQLSQISASGITRPGKG